MRKTILIDGRPAEIALDSVSTANLPTLMGRSLTTANLPKPSAGGRAQPHPAVPPAQGTNPQPAGDLPKAK